MFVGGGKPLIWLTSNISLSLSTSLHTHIVAKRKTVLLFFVLSADYSSPTFYCQPDSSFHASSPPLFQLLPYAVLTFSLLPPTRQPICLSCCLKFGKFKAQMTPPQLFLCFHNLLTSLFLLCHIHERKPNNTISVISQPAFILAMN